VNSKWNLISSDQEIVNRLATELQIHPITATILANRKISTKKEGITLHNGPIEKKTEPK